MEELNVFVSVGGTANEDQEAFVSAVEDRLRSEGINPHTVGRNTFSSDAPLKAVTELMEQCSGAVVIALERFYYPKGIEKRGGPKAMNLEEVKLPTPFNQIEAAMAYTRGMPLLMIVEEGLQDKGLLERGYDWYVLYLEPVKASLNTPEFNGVLASWKRKILKAIEETKKEKSINTADLTVGDLIKGLKTSQLWGLLAGLAALAAGAFALGAKFFPGITP